MAELYYTKTTPEGEVQVFANSGALITSFDVIDEASLSLVLKTLQQGGGNWSISPRNPSGSYWVRSPDAIFFLTCKSLEEAATLRFHLNRKVA